MGSRVCLVWPWGVVVVVHLLMMAIGDDLSSILCRSGSSLAFPNMMKMMVEVGWLFLFVAASGHCHCLILGRQGQIVVHGGAARSRGDHLGDTSSWTILDVASGAVSFTVGRFVVVVASASTITITSTSRCC